jgi:hypothetical protein
MMNNKISKDVNRNMKFTININENKIDPYKINLIKLILMLLLKLLIDF